MASQEEYKVELEFFEGPLDLLLYLIRRDEVDIYNIPIETITTQYMEYLNLMRMLDLNIAGEFIVMAATLMMIKSRMLLPVEERPEMEEEEDDPRWDLVRQLLEYKKFKDAAVRLQERELEQEDIFPLGHEGVNLDTEDPDLALQDVSIFELITAFNDVLKRARTEQIGEVFGDQFTVADQIDVVLHVVADEGELEFASLFPQAAPRSQVVCTFLAILELIRLRQIRIRQRERFGAIIISAGDELGRRPQADVETAPDEGPERALTTGEPDES